MKLELDNFQGRGVFKYQITAESRKADAVIVTLKMEVRTKFSPEWVTVATVTGMDGSGNSAQAYKKALARAEAEWDLTLTKSPGKLIAV